ncbi:MAG: MFS transporter [Acidimicrobiia bacterium]
MARGSARVTAFRRVGDDRDLRRALAGFTGFSISEFGTWVTVLVYAYSVGDATTVGTVAVAQLIPAAVLAPFLATRLDRLTRATAAMVAYGSQAIALAATAVSMGFDAPPLVTFGFAILANITVAMGRPAHNSLVPELVDDPAHLTAANVVTSAAENTGIFIGPAIAGAVMAVGTPAMALAVLAGLLGVGTMALVSVPRVRRQSMTEPRDGSQSGARAHLVRHRSAVPFLVVGGAQQISIGALDVLIVLLAVSELGVGDAGAAYLNAALGLGGVLGGLLAASMVGRSRLTPTLLVGVALRSTSLILIGAFPAAALFLAGAGIGYSVVDVANRTLLQRTVPVDSMASVFGLLESTSMAALAIGSILAPLLASAVGITNAFAVVGVITASVLALIWRPLRRAEAGATVAIEALDALTSVDMFAALQPAVQEALAREAGFVVAHAGEAVVTEGDTGDRMFVITSGTVAVTRQGNLVATLGSGDLFGEIALLANRPRIATVTPLETCRLLTLDRTGFFNAMATDPVTHAAFEELARVRTRETLGE